MKSRSHSRAGDALKFLVELVGVFAFIAIIALASVAQAAVITFDLNNVWLDPDITRPYAPALQMTGTFEWTYNEGDFENGSGQFIELYTPWYNPGIENLNITVETTSIEFSLVGNYHDRGFDLTMFLLDPLSTNQPATIDLVRSKFEIQLGVIYQGHFVSGSIVSVSEPLPGDASGDGIVDVSDLGILATNYDAGNSYGWSDGDFTGDGSVDVNDLGILATNYGNSAAAAAQGVPEPGTLAGLLGLFLGGLLVSARRKR